MSTFFFFSSPRRHWFSLTPCFSERHFHCLPGCIRSAGGGGGLSSRINWGCLISSADCIVLGFNIAKNGILVCSCSSECAAHKRDEGSSDAAWSLQWAPRSILFWACARCLHVSFFFLFFVLVTLQMTQYCVNINLYEDLCKNQLKFRAKVFLSVLQLPQNRPAEILF